MADIFDVADVVSQAQDVVESGVDAQRRQPIGFWRAAIAIVAGALWFIPGIIPGIPVVISANRWMKGKTRRPLVAMVFGLISCVFLTFTFVYLLIGLALETAVGSGTADAANSALLGVAGLVALPVAWFLGRYLFSPYAPPVVPTGEADEVGSAVKPRA